MTEDASGWDQGSEGPRTRESQDPDSGGIGGVCRVSTLTGCRILFEEVRRLS